MATKVENLYDVFTCTGNLIRDTYDARSIFFPEELRRELDEAYKEFQQQFEQLLNQTRGFENIENEYLYQAGLVGAQRSFKLKSFEISYNEFRSKGTIRRLIEALKKGKTIISSLGGAVPFVGSFVQELIDFLLRQLEKEKS